MATTRGWAMHGNIINLVSYILDIQNHEEKTEGGTYVSTSEGEFPMTEAYRWKQNHIEHESSSVGYHFQLSLPTGEGSAEDCMMLAEEWIRTISEDKARYVIAVHTNTNNIHAHIAVDKYLNDGKPWDIYWKKDQKRFREISDRICIKHGFSVLENTRERSQTYFEWMGEREDNNRDVLRKILDTVIPKVSCYDDLKSYMEQMGFKFYDDLHPTEENIFQCTVDKKLIHPMEDGNYLIRIPYQHDYILVEPEEIEWLKEDKTARITVPVDKTVKAFDENRIFQNTVDVSELKKEFEDKTRGKRKGLRIRMPDSKYIIRANRLDPNEAGEGYSFDEILDRIESNERAVTEPSIQNVINDMNDFDSILNARRNLYEEAKVKYSPQSTLFKSVRQESYFKWKASQIQKTMDENNYRNLLQQDRQNLSVMKERRYELQKQIDEVNHLLVNIDSSVEMMVEQKMENVMDITDEDIESYIQTNRNPLIEKKEKLKDMIGLYSQRINNAENEQKKEERERQNLTK